MGNVSVPTNLGSVNGGTATNSILGTITTTAKGANLLVGTSGANTTGLLLVGVLNRRRRQA